MSLQKITVQIGGEIAASLGKSLKAAQTQVSSFGRNVDRTIGDSMKSANTSFKAVLGNNLYKLSAGAGVALGAVSAGLFKLGKDFDQAFDTIRVGTGATGQALEGLKNDFREVLKNTPADMATVGSVIADVNTRTGMAGKTLQKFTNTMLDFQQITGGDAAGSVEFATRVLGDWSIGNDEASEAMNRLFRASQATGPSMQKIGETVVAFGAPLRQMGYSFEEATALIGKFGKEGVNVELVLGGLKKGLAKFDGDASKLKATMQKIKEAKTEAEAFAIAKDAFGAKAALDMSKAVREGRFEIDALVKQIKSGRDTISGLAFETADASEKFARLRNRTAAAFEPLANNVFEALGKALDKLLPKIEPVLDKIGELAKKYPGLSTAIIGTTVALLGLVAIAPMLAATISVVKSVAGGLVALKLGATIAGWAPVIVGAGKAFLAFATGPVGLTVAAIVGIGAAMVWAYQNVEWFRDGVNAVWGGITARFQAAVGALKAGWQGLTTYLGGAWKFFTGLLTGDLGRMREGFGQAFSGIQQIATAWLGWFRAMLPSGVRGVFDTVVAFIKETPARIADVGGKVITAIINGLKSKVGELMGWITSTWSNITNFFSGEEGQPPARTPSGNPRGGPRSARPGRREFGGPVRAGMPYLVGEKRPELFVPGMSGSIVPKVARPVTAAALASLLAAPLPAAAAGGAPVVVNAPVTINAAGGDAMEIRRQVELAFVDIQREVESAHRVLLND
jgi:phage-related minor tail protein